MYVSITSTDSLISHRQTSELLYIHTVGLHNHFSN